MNILIHCVSVRKGIRGLLPIVNRPGIKGNRGAYGSLLLNEIPEAVKYIPSCYYFQVVCDMFVSPGGGIGRRKGLKIPRVRARAGSSPAPGI